LCGLGADLGSAIREALLPAPPPSPDAPPEPDLSQPGVLEAFAIEAGLKPETTFEASLVYTYPDQETLGRALVAPAGVAILVGPEREQAIRAAIVEGLAEHRTPEGTYRLDNEFHYLIVRA